MNHEMEEMKYSPLRLQNVTSPSPSKVARWGIGVLQPLLIVGGLIGAIITAILHHFFDSYLNGKSVDGFWDQTTSRRVENALATVFKILFCLSVGVSLCQVSWRKVRQESFRVTDLDALLSSPSVTSLLHIRLFARAPVAMAMILIISVSPIIPVFAPSLTVRVGDPDVRYIIVPTINLAVDTNLGGMVIDSFSYGPVSESWDTATIQALLSATPMGWPIPPSCSPGCHYNVTYAAPSLLCSDLAPTQISNGTQLPPPIISLQGFNTSGSETTVLNLTVQDRGNQIRSSIPLTSPNETENYGWTLAYLPVDAYGPGDTPSGSICTFYNATYEARVSYVNSTQTNDVRVVQHYQPLNTTYKVGPLYVSGVDPVDDPSIPFAPGIGPNINMLIMADAFANRLQGSINYNELRGIFTETTTLITKTNLFKLNTSSFVVNTAGGVTNISQSLPDLVSNMTLSFMSLQLGNTTVSATIPTFNSVYVYHKKLLLATYGTAFILLAITGFLGISSLSANGVPSSNSFSQVLATTRNPELDLVTKGACLGSGTLSNSDLSSVRLRYGEVGPMETEPHAAFGVVGREEVRPLVRGLDYA